MRVLFLIPKNAPPILEGNFSKAFKEFVALCLKKTPEERPTAEDLLKHRFVKPTKKPVALVDLVERRKHFLEVMGEHISSIDEDDDPKPKTKGEDITWDGFDDTIRGIPAAGLSQSDHNKKPVKQPEPVKEEPKKKPAEKEKKPTTSRTKGDRSERTDKGADKKKKPKKPQNNGASALTSVIQPTILKLIKATKDEEVIETLNQIKLAFENAENIQPGITHNFIAAVIETLKR